MLRQQEQQEGDQDHEDADRAELALEVRECALLHRSGDLLHLLGALARREYLADQDAGDGQRQQSDHTDNDHKRQVAAAEIQFCTGLGGHVKPRHASSSTGR